MVAGKRPSEPGSPPAQPTQPDNQDGATRHLHLLIDQRLEPAYYQDIYARVRAKLLEVDGKEPSPIVVDGLIHKILRFLDEHDATDARDDRRTSLERLRRVTHTAPSDEELAATDEGDEQEWARLREEFVFEDIPPTLRNFITRLVIEIGLRENLH